MTTSTPTSPLVPALRTAGFVGRVVDAGDPDYDSARAGWNGAIDRRPAAVAYATDSDDVAAAIRAARASGLKFTIRSGGHSVSGRSVRNGALCIDLRALNSVNVDPETKTVRVGGGALLSELDAATQGHGLAVPAGQISHTGVGGLTLGGGIGWLMRHHGLTIDSLLSADVVLADGETVHASADEHPDLFWALRGGGGDFGVVTSFEFQAHPVGPMVLGGMLVYPFDQAAEVFRASRELMAGAPDELGLCAVLLTAPPEEPFPAELQGQKVAVISVAWSGDIEEGERFLAPLRAEAPSRARSRGPDAVRRAPVHARRQRSPRLAVLRPHALPPRRERRLRRRAGRRARDRAHAPVARDHLVDGRRGRPGPAWRDRVRPSRRVRLHVAHRVLGRRADRRDRRLGASRVGEHRALRHAAAST